MSKLNGFTLIELVIAVFLITLLAGISVPAVYRFQREASLKTSANEIKSAVLQARNFAMAPRVYPKNADGSGMNQIESYAFSCDVATREYKIMEKPTSGAEIEVRGTSRNLPENIEFSAASCASNIYFSVAEHGKSNLSASRDIVITANNYETATVQVNSSGNVIINM